MIVLGEGLHRGTNAATDHKYFTGFDMTKDELLTIFANLSMWERDGVRAPHKPLLLLYALAELKRGHKWLVYSEIEKPIENILETILPQRKSLHSHYPFWYLKTAGLKEGHAIWRIYDISKIKMREGKTEPLKSELRRFGTRAGFTDEALDIFEKQPMVIEEVIQGLLDSQFPRTIQEYICSMLGLDLPSNVDAFSSGSNLKRMRDPKFREKVLTAYRGECAVCGYSLRVRDKLAGIEAAHIKWHQAGGPDVENNGLSLCSTHHILFDRGAFTIDEALYIRVSDQITGSLFIDVLDQYKNKMIRKPQRESQYPSVEYLKWHKGQVLVGDIL